MSAFESPAPRPTPEPKLEAPGTGLPFPDRLIVGKSIEGVIFSLCVGKVPDEKADVAKVKPTNLLSDPLSELKIFAPDLMKRIDEVLLKPGMSLNSKSKFTHPWFGDMTAKQWYWLLSRHQGIHYRQAKEIIQRLTH